MKADKDQFDTVLGIYRNSAAAVRICPAALRCAYF